MNQLIEVKRCLKLKPKALSILRDQVPHEVTSVAAAPADVNGNDTGAPRRQDAPPRPFQQIVSKLTMG